MRAVSRIPFGVRSAVALLAVLLAGTPGPAPGQSSQLRINGATVTCPGAPAQPGPQTCHARIPLEWTGADFGQSIARVSCSFEVTAYCVRCEGPVTRTLRTGGDFQFIGGRAEVVLSGDVHFDVTPHAMIGAASVTNLSCSAHPGGG